MTHFLLLLQDDSYTFSIQLEELLNFVLFLTFLIYSPYGYLFLFSQGKVKIKVDEEKDDIMDDMDEFEKEMAQEMADRLFQVQQVSYYKGPAGISHRIAVHCNVL